MHWVDKLGRPCTSAITRFCVYFNPKPVMNVHPCGHHGRSAERSSLDHDLVKHRPIDKVRLAGLGPAAKSLVNREQLERGKLLGVFGLRLGRNWPVKMLANEVLGLFGVKVVQVSRGHRARAFFVHVFVHHGTTGPPTGSPCLRCRIRVWQIPSRPSSSSARRPSHGPEVKPPRPSTAVCPTR